MFSTVYSVHRTVHTVFHPVFSVLRTVHTVFSTVRSVLRTVHTVFCTVQFTVQAVHVRVALKYSTVQCSLLSAILPIVLFSVQTVIVLTNPKNAQILLYSVQYCTVLNYLWTLWTTFYSVLLKLSLLMLRLVNNVCSNTELVLSKAFRNWFKKFVLY